MLHFVKALMDPTLITISFLQTTVISLLCSKDDSLSLSLLNNVYPLKSSLHFNCPQASIEVVSIENLHFPLHIRMKLLD